MNLLASIRQRFLPALKDLVEDPAPLLDLVRPAQDARFGDFQANFAMPLAKQLGRNPRELAQQIVDSVDLGDFCEPLEVAGPGFINVRISTSHLETLLQQVAGDDRLGVVPVSSPRHFVVDFSSLMLQSQCTWGTCAALSLVMPSVERCNSLVTRSPAIITSGTGGRNLE